jgi:aryl-alcohol dehydrogenase-like predicted oxidoreductase
LAWLISQPGVITPIASGKSLKQLNEIFQEVNLTSQELDDLTNF